MLEAIKKLVDGGIINESTRDQINEAWEEKLAESKEAVRAELREEFASRYKHDKSVMVESIDKMVTESLTKELSEFAEDKKALASDRVALKRTMRESAKKFESFVAKQLAVEVKEFRNDRKVQNEATGRLETFVMRQLAEEITEFSKDKQAVIETKVKLISEAKAKMNQIKKKFVTKAARLVKESITSNVETEMTQLKEDITSARENMFGRKIFEAFASEFTLTHLSENKEIAKLRNAIEKRDTVIAESRKTVAKSKKLVESKDKKINSLTENKARNKKLDMLVKSLNADKASTMRDLLESVQTNKLTGAFEKYLPAVLNTGSSQSARKSTLNESRKVRTGNKNTAKQNAKVADDTVVDIKRLAGL